MIAFTTIEYEYVTFSESSDIRLTLQDLFPEITYIEDTFETQQKPKIVTRLFGLFPQVVLGLFLIIAIVFYTQWAIQWILLKRLLKQTSKYSEQHKIFINDRFHTAFAFDKNIYVPKSFLSLEEDEFQKIVAHEKAHIHLGHGFDNLILSLLKPILWYNPLFWYLRHELKKLHEYQADEVCTSDTSIDSYTQLLLKLNSPENPSNFIHPFSKSLIKKRVIKLNQLKSSIMKKVLFLAALPLVAVLFYAFSIQPIERKIPIIGSNENIGPLILPMSRGSITKFTPFGMRNHPVTATRRMHTGIDLVAPMGTEIYAANAGVIQVAELDETGYGNHIEIEHEDGLKTRYAHLKALNVEKGQTVNQGELIGYCGNTGKSTGPHLHFEVLRNDTALNPEDYLQLSMKEFGNRHGVINKENLVIIIDAAHGGKDAGTQRGDIAEKDLCLDYAKALDFELKAKGYKVHMTRTRDEFISLETRASITDGDNPNTVFISLHTNEEKSGKASGIEIFTPQGSDNRSEESMLMAKHLQSSLDEKNFTTRQIQQADYWVLANTNCIAVIVELGFLSSDEDRTNLLKDDYRKVMITSIVQGIDNYSQ